METTILKMFTDTIKNENGLIWIKPLCDFFKLHVENQYHNIKKDPILTKLVQKNRPDLDQNENLVRKNIPDFGEIDKNGRILLSQKGFLRWIQTINPNTIPIGIRDNFILYQEMVSGFLFGSMEEHETITWVNHELQ